MCIRDSLLRLLLGNSLFGQAAGYERHLAKKRRLTENLSYEMCIRDRAMDAGNMQVGEMIAFITYTMQIVMSFLLLAMVAVMLPRAGVAADRIDEVCRTKASIHDPDAATAKPALEKKDWAGAVSYTHLDVYKRQRRAHARRRC